MRKVWWMVGLIVAVVVFLVRADEEALHPSLRNLRRMILSAISLVVSIGN